MITKQPKDPTCIEQRPGLGTQRWWSHHQHATGTVWLASSPGYGQRYSILGLAPFAHLRVRQGVVHLNGAPQEGSVLPWLKAWMAQHVLPEHPDLPLLGGCLGYLGYGARHWTEDLPASRCVPLPTPELCWSACDLLVIDDHTTHQHYLISNGLPEQGLARCARAQERMAWLLAQEQVITTQKAPEPCAAWPVQVRSHHTPEDYQARVAQVQEDIRAGELFQMCLSQRFDVSYPRDPRIIPSWFSWMQQHNPAPFMGFVRDHDHTLMVASPERFFSVKQDQILVSPIKGTLKRAKDPEHDAALGAQLTQCPKNRAENIMIVDLMRNDLSRVCTPDSVEVAALCALESFPHVHHLVSHVTGTLRFDLTLMDVLQALCPGGSVTGAPKIRAMERITALELFDRGPYCGALGYLAFDGNADMAIIIRALVLGEERGFFQVGGAITLASNPQEEYEETLAKAQGLVPDTEEKCHVCAS